MGPIGWRTEFHRLDSLCCRYPSIVVPKLFCKKAGPCARFLANHVAEKARQSSRPVPRPAVADPEPPSPARAPVGADGLERLGSEDRCSVLPRSGAVAAADPAAGGAALSERAAAAPDQPGALAGAHGFASGAAAGADAGGGDAPGPADGAGAGAGGRGHDGAGEGGGVPDGCAPVSEDADGAGARGAQARRAPSAELPAGGQGGAADAGAVCAGAADAAGGRQDAGAADLSGAGAAGCVAEGAASGRGAGGIAGARRAPVAAAARRHGQGVQRACRGGGVRRPGQGAPALRVRLQGVVRGHLEGQLGRVGAEPAGEPVRRAHAGGGAGAGRGFDGPASEACVLRPRLSGARGIGRDAGASGRAHSEGGEPFGAEMDEAAGGDRADHRASEVGPPARAELLEGPSRRPRERGSGGRRLQPRQIAGRVFLRLEKNPGNRVRGAGAWHFLSDSTQLRLMTA